MVVAVDEDGNSMPRSEEHQEVKQGVEQFRKLRDS
jgi:hypothetical protein